MCSTSSSSCPLMKLTFVTACYVPVLRKNVAMYSIGVEWMNTSNWGQIGILKMWFTNTVKWEKHFVFPFELILIIYFLILRVKMKLDVAQLMKKVTRLWSNRKKYLEILMLSMKWQDHRPTRKEEWDWVSHHQCEEWMQFEKDHTQCLGLYGLLVLMSGPCSPNS